MSIAVSSAPPLGRIGPAGPGGTVIAGPWPARPVPLRITRRGRLALCVATLAATIGLVLAGLALLGGPRAATPGSANAPGSAAPASGTVVVLPGETLWEIAGRVAPEADRRDTVIRIERVNGLAGAKVRAGTRLRLPPAEGRL